jgi:hypothetical protein
MKRNIYIIFLLLFFGRTIAQPCTGIEELLRKRHKIDGMSYGHPYTTFDTHNLNYVDLDNAINNIRKRIIKEKSRYSTC